MSFFTSARTGGNSKNVHMALTATQRATESRSDDDLFKCSHQWLWEKMGAWTRRDVSEVPKLDLLMSATLPIDLLPFLEIKRRKWLLCCSEEEFGAWVLISCTQLGGQSRPSTGKPFLCACRVRKRVWWLGIYIGSKGKGLPWGSSESSVQIQNIFSFCAYRRTFMFYLEWSC